MDVQSHWIHAIRRLLLYLLAWIGRMLLIRHTPVFPPHRILLIKPDHLGDVLLATPALAQVRQQFPQATIVALIGPWSAFMLADHPAVDALVTLPFPGFDRQQRIAPPRRNVLLSLRTVIQPYGLLFYYATLMRAGHFDAALLLRDDHWWGAALALLAGIPSRVGYAAPECRPFLSHALPWNPAEHVTAQALKLVAALGNTAWKSDDQQPALYFAPSAADQIWARAWLDGQSIGPDHRLVVIHPGTGGAAKQWPVAYWAAVANTLASVPHIRLVLTGGPGEEALVHALASQMQQPVPMLAGATSVGQLAALLKQASLVLGVDSGPLHIAVSQGTPSLHLFGPGDAGRFGPWGDPARHVVLRTGLWCSPCGIFHACPRQTDPPECMASITVAQVVAAACKLLQ